MKTLDPSFVHDTCAGAVVLHFVEALPIAPTSQPRSATLLFLGKEQSIFSMSLESSCREKYLVPSAKRFSSTSYTSKWKVGSQPTALANQFWWRNQIRNWRVRCFCQIMRNPVRCVNGKHAHILSTEKAAWVEWKKINSQFGLQKLPFFPRKREATNSPRTLPRNIDASAQHRSAEARSAPRRKINRFSLAVSKAGSRAEQKWN